MIHVWVSWRKMIFHLFAGELAKNIFHLFAGELAKNIF